MPLLSKHKIEFIDDDPFFFRRFLREVEKSNWCIKYYLDGCGTCGCFQFKKELNQYSDKVILAGLLEISKSKLKTVNEQGNLFNSRFHDIIGLCLDKISKKFTESRLAGLIKGTPIGDFREKKIKDGIKVYCESEVRKARIEQRLREQKLIKQYTRWAEHLKRIKKYKQRTKDMYLDRLPSRQE